MTIIEIASIEPPREGKKMGKVTSADGNSYHVFLDKIVDAKIGSRYAVEIEEQEFNGRPWKKITKAKPANGAAPSSPAASKPTSADDEQQFVRELLVVGLRTGAVAFSAHDLRTAVAMLRTVWRESC